MNQKLLTLFDIFPLEPIARDALDVNDFALIIGLCVTLFLFFLKIRSYQTPLKKIYRQVQSGRIPPREGAHSLALLLPRDDALQDELSYLRFAKQPPNVERLLSLMQRIK